MAPDKTVGPSTVLPFTSRELDTVHSQARLPHDKFMRCTSMLSDQIEAQEGHPSGNYSL